MDRTGVKMTPEEILALLGLIANMKIQITNQGLEIHQLTQQLTDALVEPEDGT